MIFILFFQWEKWIRRLWNINSGEMILCVFVYIWLIVSFWNEQETYCRQVGRRQVSYNCCWPSSCDSQLCPHFRGTNIKRKVICAIIFSKQINKHAVRKSPWFLRWNDDCEEDKAASVLWCNDREFRKGRDHEVVAVRFPLCQLTCLVLVLFQWLPDVICT